MTPAEIREEILDILSEIAPDEDLSVIDDEKSHQKFISKFQLPFDLLADTDKKIVEAYGVWGEKSMYGKKYMGTNRKTFLIDADGKIAKVFDKVDVAAHADEVLEAFGEK